MPRGTIEIADYAHRLTPGSVAMEALEFLSEHHLRVIANPRQNDYDLIDQLGELIAPNLPTHPAFAASRNRSMYDRWRTAFPSGHMYMVSNAVGELVSATCFEPVGAGKRAQSEIWSKPVTTQGASSMETLAALEAQHGFTAVMTSMLDNGVVVDVTKKDSYLKTICKDVGYKTATLGSEARDPSASGIKPEYMVLSRECIDVLNQGPEPSDRKLRLITGD